MHIDEADINDRTATDGLPGLGDPGLLDVNADKHVRWAHAGLMQLDDGDEGEGVAEAPKHRELEKHWRR